jgi:colanic acid biosynthesis glycosyl transferase WcaI
LVLNNQQKLYVWCQFFYPELISTGQVITELFVRLSDKFNIEVHCAQPTIKKSDRVPTVLLYRGVKIVRLWSSTFPKISIIGKIINQLTYSTSLLVRALFLPKGSHVNVFTDPFFLPLLLYIINPVKRFKYTITLFDLYPETLSQNQVLSSRSFLYRFIDNLTNKVYANASNVITIGRCMQKIVTNRPINWKQKPEFIPIWCDTDNIRQKNLPENYFRDLWNITKDNFVVGYSGNLAKFHPIETFIKAAEILKDRNDIKFIFVGEGAKKKWAQSYCEKNNLTNCHFQSYVEREQLGSLLASFDCGLVGLNPEQTGLSVPSKTIGLMSAGVPIIACVDKTSETAHILKEHNCGYLCPPMDPGKLAELILKLKDNPKEREFLRNNAIHAVDSDFHIQQIVESYSQILRSQAT